MVQCQRQGDRAAQGVADDQRPLEAERLGKVRDGAGLGVDRRRILRRAR